MVSFMAPMISALSESLVPSMSYRANSASRSTGLHRQSPSTFRAKTVLPAPIKVIFFIGRSSLLFSVSQGTLLPPRRSHYTFSPPDYNTESCTKPSPSLWRKLPKPQKKIPPPQGGEGAALLSYCREAPPFRPVTGTGWPGAATSTRPGLTTWAFSRSGSPLKGAKSGAFTQPQCHRSRGVSG